MPLLRGSTTSTEFAAALPMTLRVLVSHHSRVSSPRRLNLRCDASACDPWVLKVH